MFTPEHSLAFYKKTQQCYFQSEQNVNKNVVRHASSSVRLFVSAKYYHQHSHCDNTNMLMLNAIKNVSSLLVITKHKVQLRLTGISLVLEIFSRKPKPWMSLKCSPAGNTRGKVTHSM